MIYEIGRHKVRHGDVMEGLDSLMGDAKADILYSDPPWGEGNLKYWQTMNVKQNPGAERTEVNLLAFLNNIFDIASKYCKEICLIEYGVRWDDLVKEYGEKHGFIHNGFATSRYKTGNGPLPLHLHVFSRVPLNLPESYFKSIEWTYDMNTLRAAITPFIKPNYTILDPCCGMGFTAQFAIDNGLTFYGNELSNHRIQKTLKRLRNENSK